MSANRITIIARLESNRPIVRADGIRRGKVWLGNLLDWGYTAQQLDGLIRELDFHIKARDAKRESK